MRNYWSLYYHFLQEFKELTYKGFSLPYILHFPNLVRNNKEVANALGQENFADTLTYQINHQREFQAAFTKYVNSHHKRFKKKKINNGKIAIHVDPILRIPDKSYQKSFKKSKSLIVVADPTTSSTSKNKTIKFGLPVKNLCHYRTSAYKKEILAVQNKARALFQSTKHSPFYQNQLFQAKVIKKIPQAIKMIEQVNQFFDEVPISCVLVSSTHSYISRILSLVAAERGIPSICLQHGIMNSEQGFIPKIATIDAVYGQFEVDWYKQLGVNQHGLKIIGHPRFDQAKQLPQQTRKAFHQNLGLDPRKKTIMLVVRENQKIEKWRLFLKTIYAKKLDVNILIKDIPGKDAHPLTKEFPVVSSSKISSLYDILPHVDCVVSYTSTVALESMLADKPVFILDNSFPNYTGYYNPLNEMVQKDPRKLAKLVTLFFTTPHWKSYAKNKREQFLRYAYPYKGISEKRLKALIYELMNGKFTPF